MTEEKLKEIATKVMCDDYLSGWLKENDPITYKLTKEISE